MLERFRDALAAFAKPRVKDTAPPATGRTLSMGMTSIPLTPVNNYKALADGGYRRNAVVYACVNEITSSVAQPKIKVVNPDTGLDVRSSHPLTQLLSKPNPQQTKFALFEGMVGNLQVMGNAYLQKVRNKYGMPVELWNVRPDRMKVKVDSNGDIEYYEYSIETKTIRIPTEDIIHIKLYDPLDDYYGLSPLAVAARAIDLDNQSLDYLRSFFTNGASPSGILKFEDPQEPEERERVKRLWREMYGSAKGWHDIAVLDASVEYQEIGSTPSKLKLEHIWSITETRICFVPDTLVHTISGLKPIGEIKVGDRVLTHKGRWRKVLETFRSENLTRKMVKVKGFGLPELTCTEDHPFYVGNVSQDRNHRKSLDSISWTRAGELAPKVRNKRGDSNTVTIPGLSIPDTAPDLDLSEWIHGKRFSVENVGGELSHSHPLVKKIPSKIKMGTALGRLLGFYMAEGSTGGGKVNFAFNANEEDFYLCVAKDLMDVFGLSSDLIHNEKCNTKTVSCQSAMLVELFKCGTSKNKKLPEWAWLGGRDFFRGVIHAWLAGDGCERGERGVIRGHTISQDLAYQMHLIAISVGYPASVCRYDSGITSTVIQGRTVNTNPIHYKVSFTADRDESRSSTLIHDDIWHTPVESVEESCYVGDVCNLHVEEDESYVTIGGAAHNCMTLGVPPILIQSYVGLTRATYANYREAVKAFWSETLIPMYTRIEEQLTKELGSEFAGDPAIVFDLSTVDALQESRAEARKFALEAWKTDLLSRDRALRLSSMQEVDGKDVYYSELVKASQPAPAPTEEPDPEVEDETKTFPVAEDDNEGDAEDE